MVEMDIGGEDSCSRGKTIPNTTLRNLSSSSSAFYSANQSPFISPRSATSRLSTHVENVELESLANTRFAPVKENDPSKFENVSSSTGISHSPLSRYNIGHNSEKIGKLLDLSVPAASYSSNRSRSCDVYIGFHGRKPLLLRFTNWFRAELEVQGLSCFVTDRAKCRNSHKQNTIEKAMDGCTFGVVILTKKSFRNPYTIEEMRFFSSKKNLVPIYFDLGPDDCLVRDITERRGEIWEIYGGELWLHYGGLKKEWKEAVSALTRVDEWKLEARDGKWRDCILRAVTLLALRLGRRSVVDRITKWREKVEKEEFPYPRNENFVGRKKEMSELEFMLLGDISGDAEKDYFELKARPRRKNLTIGWGRTNSIDDKQKDRLSESSSRKGKGKGKAPVLWKESEKEIEMQNTEFSLPRPSNSTPRSKSNGRRKRSTRVVYGKGIACVSGESGIGKTELLLEFAYRFHQRYKMVLWIGGESRYIRQNYLNLRSFLEVDVGVDNLTQKGRRKSFEEQEEAAISRVRKELMRNIPFLLIIDNLESEKDWWDHKLLMDLLPRFGGQTHVIISSRLSRVMNLEPLKLSYLSGIEAMSLMQGNVKDQSVTEIDSLRVIEEKLGRLTLGIAIVGAILSEIPITPCRLLDAVNRMPSKDITWNSTLRRNTFLLQLIEVCFSIFDNADRPRSLATRMVLASGWFAPAPAPITILALAANKAPNKHPHRKLWKKILRALSCNFTSSYARKSETEASSVLQRFSLARNCTKEGFIQFNDLVKLYARKRGISGASQATVEAIITRGSISTSYHTDHIWGACFLLLGFGNDPIVVKLKISELLYLVKDVILPLARKTFLVFSRCSAAMELLRLCTDALETADQAFVTPVEKWVDKSFCWRSIKTSAQLNPQLWQELALARAMVLEVRAKLMVRGGQLDIGDDLIRKAVFIRSSICGEDHPDTVSAKETLGKLTRLIASVQIHNTSL